jgi:hypothetical protein
MVIERLEERTLFTTMPGAALAAGSGTGGDPIELASGTLIYNTTDLQSDGFGSDWGVTRSWTNNSAFQLPSSHVGNGWDMNQNPQIFDPAGITGPLEVVTSGSKADWFQNTALSGTPVFSPYFDSYDQLNYNSTADTYTLTDKQGNQTTFYGFSDYSSYAGTFDSYQPASGSIIQVTSHDSSGDITQEEREQTVGGTTTFESLQYNYSGSGITTGELDNVTLRRNVSGLSPVTIREAQYAYYGSDDPHGNADDLKTATIEDGAGNVLSEDYYRYYIASDTTGDNLEYAFAPNNVARMQAELSDPFTESSPDLTKYASLQLTYDSSVYESAGTPGTSSLYTLFPIQSEIDAGTSSTEGTLIGQGTYDFTYTTSSLFDSDGITFSPYAGSSALQFNQFAYQTVVTQPNGLTDTYDMNYAGETILESQTDGSTTRNTYDGYNAQARMNVSATALAVASADLSDGSFSLNANAGEITNYDYSSSTTSAGSTSAGNVYGYLEDKTVQQGTAGTADEVESYNYKSQTVSGVSIYYVADDTVYRNASASGSGGETTSYQYNYTTGTFSPTELTTTLPTISTAENGPNSSTAETQVFDADGNVVWERDPRGYVSYTAYNISTGAVAETIEDVTSSDAPTSPPISMPSWSLSADPLALVTTYQTDAQGRTTEVTDPNLNVTYTVYNDSSHTMIVYPGWHETSGSNYTTTGPVQVTDDNWALGYNETFTYEYSPSGSSAPNGSDTPESLESLSIEKTNYGGQVTEKDQYFSLSGITYSAASSYFTALGTIGTNYYATLYTYDAGGNLDRVQTPTGTITRTVYNKYDEPIQTWVGAVIGGTADDAGWPTAGNMTLVSKSSYDVDANLLETADYPSTSSSGRATVNYYDFRDRLIATMTGAVESADSIGDPLLTRPATTPSSRTIRWTTSAKRSPPRRTTPRVSRSRSMGRCTMLRVPRLHGGSSGRRG